VPSSQLWAAVAGYAGVRRAADVMLARLQPPLQNFEGIADGDVVQFRFNV
jgi:hypothetical protein